MKPLIKPLPFFIVVIAAIDWLMACSVAAQTFTTIHQFADYPNDASTSLAGLVLSPNNSLYGTTVYGGSSGNGTVFTIRPDGTGFTNSYSFASANQGLNSDGVAPLAGLVLSERTVYGTTIRGGSSGWGTVFRVDVDGAEFANLHNFSAIFPPCPCANGDGANAWAGLTLAGSKLYGAAGAGGAFGSGVLFAINTDGSDFTPLYNFTAAFGSPRTNSDGGGPVSRLVIAGNTLCGTSPEFGNWGNGTVFAVNTDGTGFTNLHNFSATTVARDGSNRNSDGAKPVGGLTLSGGRLYGTAQAGGTGGNGTVFVINIGGTGFTNLYSFTQRSNSDSGYPVNSDGAAPNGELVLSGDTLYGTAFSGGRWGNGTIFAVKTNGTSFTNLYSFTAGSGSAETNADGAHPQAGLILFHNALYGTARCGGTLGIGTVFRFSLPPPQLSVTSIGPNAILSWPASFTGFALQSTTNLIPASVWTPVPAEPVIINGQNIVTNRILGMQQFFRLSQ